MGQEREVLGEFTVAQGLWGANPLLAPPGALVAGRNLTCQDGRLRKRRGYVLVKENGVASKRVRLAHTFLTSSLTACLVACTSSDIWFWDSGTSTFVDKGNLGGSDTATLHCCDWGVGYMYLCKQGQNFAKWDGGAGDFTGTGATKPAGAGGGNLYPRFVRPYAGSLIAANDGSSYQQHVYWSDALLPDAFTGGVSGWAALVDGRGPISGMELVGRALGIWAYESIHTMLYVGGAAPFIFHRAEPTIGTRSPESIRTLGPPFAGQVVFLGSDMNIHTFDGLRCVPQAGVIHSILKDLLEEDYLEKAWAFVDPKEAAYYLAVPTSGSTENNLVIEWRYRLGQFYLHEIGAAGGWTATAWFPKSAALTWTELETAGTTWDALDKTWAELLQETGSRPMGFLGANGDFVKLFEGVNDGAAGVVNGWGEFAPFSSAAHEQKESAYLEILDDRASGDSTLSVGLGASADGAHFVWERRDHSLLPSTDMPKENFRLPGRWFKVAVQNNRLNQQFNLRGWRLYGLPVGKDR